MRYEKPEMNIIVLETEDVITTSGGGLNNGGEQGNQGDSIDFGNWGQ